jgi:hypothetical protein
MENTNHDNTITEKLNSLKEGDYIAFGFNYNGGEPKEIIVSNITSVYEDKVLVHFLYGHHSLGEFINKNNILAIGNNQCKGKIKGWSGGFDILKPWQLAKLNK